ncbi:MAG: hypothetical protein PVH93_07785 [Nitrosopumilaceae archaeon]|jgi:hypothetical protein
MSTYANERIEENPFQWNPPKSRNVVIVIYMLEAITKVGRYFPIIVLSLASLNIVMAANDFLANSVEFGIMNSLFAMGGIISLVQMHQRAKIQSIDSSHRESNFNNAQKIGNEMR